MPSGRISNPNQAYGQSGVGYQQVEEYLASGDIVAGDWVSFTGSNTVEQMDVSDATAATLSAGVATTPALSGRTVLVCVAGEVDAKIGNTTGIVVGDVAVKHGTTDGAAGRVASGNVDATTVVTSVLGVYLAAGVGGFARVNVGRR